MNLSLIILFIEDKIFEVIDFSNNTILYKHWQPLSLIYTQEMADTFKLVHQACQFIAITEKSVFPPRFDDSHTSFFWDYRRMRFVSEWMHFERTFRLEVDPVLLRINIVNYGGDELASLKMVGRSRKEVYAQLRQTLTTAGIKVERFATDMHYDLPMHSVFKGGKYLIINKELNLEINKYYSNAYLILNFLKGLMPASDVIRCWPHHFDMTFDNKVLISEPDGYNMLTVGFSPSDGILEKPFFYVGLKNSLASKITEKTKLAHGKWLTGDLVGTYVCISSLLGVQKCEEQVDILLHFFNESFERFSSLKINF
jgi:hypothetical protein